MVMKKLLQTVMEKQIENYGYPPPTPPKTKKADIFKLEDFKALDKYASTVSDFNLNTGMFLTITNL